MKKTIVALLCGTALAPGAFAQEADAPKYYWWAGYGTGNYDQTFAGDTARLGTVQGKLGWRFLSNFAVEGEGGIGVDEDRIFVARVKVKNQWGAYGVAYLPVGDTFDLFARAGYATATTETRPNIGPTVTEDNSGTGLGAGAIWYVGPLDVRFEYTRYEFGDKADAYMMSIGSRF